jgi:hypothetical protein
MNMYQAFGMNPVNNRDPWGLKTDFNYFGTKKSYAQALNSLVVTTADRRQLGRVAEGGANIIPAIIYFIQDLAEVVTGEDFFPEDWRFSFNFSEPGSIIQLYPTEKCTYWEKVRDVTVVYPTGKFIANTGADFILGYNDPYVMNTPVGQEARENFDRQLIPLGATSYGVYKGISLIKTKGQATYNSTVGSTIKYNAKAGRFYDANTGKFIKFRDVPWPEPYGFVSYTENMAKTGQIVDRYGSPGGKYLAPEGTPYAQRGIPEGYVEYHKYKVLKPFKWYEGSTAPVKRFDSPGGGYQYMTKEPIWKLIKEGYLEEIQ